MEELIRDEIHSALEVEPTPVHLRAHVMASLPVTARHAGRYPMRLTGPWSVGVVASLLALAIIAGLLYSRGLLPLVPARPHIVPPVGLISPEGITVAPYGSVYVSDYLGDRVFKLRPNGKVSVFAGGGVDGDGPATKANLYRPAGLAIDRAGNVYVADSLGGSIRRIDTVGVISTVAIRGLEHPVHLPGGPFGLAFDSSGALWVSEFYGEIRQIFVASGGDSNVLDTSSLPPPNLVPGHIAFDRDGNLYIADRSPDSLSHPAVPPSGGCRIVKVTPELKLSIIAGTGECGYAGDGGPAINAQLNDPGGIAFDATGNLYFADSENHRIRRIDKNGIITTVAGTGVAGFSGDGGRADGAQLDYPYGMGVTSSGLLYFADASCSCSDPPIAGRVRAINLASGTITTVMDGDTQIQTT